MTEIKATLHLKNSEKKQFVHKCVDESGKLSLKEIHKASSQLQKEINEELTILVETEKSALKGKQSKEINDDDLDDDDEDEDEEINPPDEKKART